MTATLSMGGGVLLGFASSLHCIGMCGGIALVLGLPATRGSGARALLDHLPLHGGRALAYMTLGGLAGGLGSLALGAVAMPAGHLILRWAAAMTLAWVGLSTMGLMPSPAVIGHALLPRFATGRGGAAGASVPALGRLAAGLGWGLMPCGMVYGALFYAAFTGSVLGGLQVMAGFALGTMPALLLVQAGSSAFARLARKPGIRWATGAAILLLALLSLLPGEASLLALCRSVGLPF